MIESWFGNYKKGSGPDGLTLASHYGVRATQNFIGRPDAEFEKYQSENRQKRRRTNESLVMQKAHFYTIL